MKILFFHIFSQTHSKINLSTVFMSQYALKWQSKKVSPDIFLLCKNVIGNINVHIHGLIFLKHLGQQCELHLLVVAHLFYGYFFSVLLCRSSWAQSGCVGSVSQRPFLGLSRHFQLDISPGSGCACKRHFNTLNEYGSLLSLHAIVILEDCYSKLRSRLPWCRFNGRISIKCWRRLVLYAKWSNCS